MMRMTIVFSNASLCTGSCGYCTARLDIPSLKNATKVDETILRAVSRRLYDLIQVDYLSLEKTIMSHPNHEDDEWEFSIWGGDPLASFDNYVDLYEFLTDLGAKNSKKVTFTGSTNGLAFACDEYAEWLLSKDNIKMQLSHDGLGQYVRTNDIDPLALDCMKEVWTKGTLRSVNCVLSQLNFSPRANIAYFDKFPFVRNIRLYTARDEIYTMPIECNGWLNGIRIPELKGYKVVDMAIHNDPSKREFEHAADILFDELFWMGEMIRAGKLNKYKNSYIKRIKEIVGDVNKRPSCARFHLGQQEWSNCVDTLGFYTECHLMDHTQHVPNKELKHPDKCKDCKFINCKECNYCGRTNLSENQCQLNYRLNLWARHFVDLTNNS